MAANRSIAHAPASLKGILSISDEAMDQALAVAYEFYGNGRFTEAETICGGLIACDPEYWWAHALHGSALRKMGRHQAALSSVELGLKYEPGQPKLLLMREELLLTIARNATAGGNVSPAAAKTIASPDRAA